MEAITKFFGSILSQFNEANFALLAIIDFAAYVAVFLAALFGCAVSSRLRSGDKRAFFHLTNIFTAITLAVFLTKFTLPQSVAVAAVFWILGYAAYGLLCTFKCKKSEPEDLRAAAPIPEVRPVSPTSPSRPAPAHLAVQPAPQSAVRLDHALNIADKLLLKNLGRGDRQELEKIKTALTVLKVKGILSAQEGEALNDMFNALLKLMAKYDL